MLKVVSDDNIRSEVSIVPFYEAESLPALVHAHKFRGKPVVTM
jgi:hypothetical protein